MGFCLTSLPNGPGTIIDVSANTSYPFTTLRLRRLIAGLPQQTLADRIGRSQPWLSRAERGVIGAIVSPEDAARIATALGVPSSNIFDDPEGEKR